MRILILDNYDSFTFNLVHLVEKITNASVEVHRNDAIGVDDIQPYDRIILSPGPGVPADAGILLQVIKTYHATRPILGVCLGHQAIAEALGGTLINLSEVFHGVATDCVVDNQSKLFHGLPGRITVGRYHSWAVDEQQLPSQLQVIARDSGGMIMAMQHRLYPLHSVQFHPESVLTPDGEQILRNWLN